MLKYCIEKWEQNKKILEEVLSKNTTLNGCDYEYLVHMVVKYILNTNPREDDIRFNDKKIVVVDHGDYQGCQLFVVPVDTYQPRHWEYIIGYQNYGSCSGCDILLGIQGFEDGAPNERQLKEYMAICKDIVCSFVHPFKGYDESQWTECEV